jgi:hypothetical protein
MAEEEAAHKRFIQQLDREKIVRYKSRQVPGLKISVSCAIAMKSGKGLEIPSRR